MHLKFQVSRNLRSKITAVFSISCTLLTLTISALANVDCSWGSWDPSDANTSNSNDIRPLDSDGCPPSGEKVRGKLSSVWHFRLNVPSSSGGANGANRIVKIKGFQGVAGTFSEPVFGPLVKTTGIISKHKSNKPTMYLGAEGDWLAPVMPVATPPTYKRSGTVKIDAGLQWENNLGSSAATSYAGWVIYHRVTVFPNPGRGSWNYYDNSPVRIPLGGLGSTTLTYQLLTNGKGRISCASSSFSEVQLRSITTGLPRPGNPKYLKYLKEVSVRRVVGLTQSSTGGKSAGVYNQLKSTVNLDGTFVKNLNFSGGTVFTLRASGTTSQIWPADTSSSRYGALDSPITHATNAIPAAAGSPNGNTDFLRPDDTNGNGSDKYIIDLPSNKRTKPRQGTLDLGWYINKGYSNEKVVIQMGDPKVTARGKSNK